MSRPVNSTITKAPLGVGRHPHSMTSVKLAKITTSHDKLEAGPTYGHFRARDHNGRNRSDEERRKRSHQAWHRAIRASGLQFMYTTGPERPHTLT